MRTLVFLRLLSITLAMLAFSAACFAYIDVGISVSFGPPPIPVYEQPICPADGYIWTPGYWAWDSDVGDYYWVPGTWVMAPEARYFWTPGWWGWDGSAFIFHPGYWGPRVGFYGGINYGFGYFGHGYEGGRWDKGHFFYNRSVNNVNVTVIHNVYNTTVVNNERGPRVSYNGGQGGISARANAEEEAAARERHVPPVAAQTKHFQAARSNQELRASANHGKPPIAATPKPNASNEQGAVPARKGGNYKPPVHSADTSAHPGAPPVHPNEVPPHGRPEPNTGNAKVDQKYQQQQEKLCNQQQRAHQKLQQNQDQERQKLQQIDASNKQQVQQQVEQKHQQQTKQLEQKHTQRQQKMQTHQQPPQAPPPHESSPKPPK